MKNYAKSSFLLLLAASSLSACARPHLGKEVADRLASPAWMIDRTIPAGPFAMTAYERMHERHAPADIYIEGDGKAWVSKDQVSLNPTPFNPVALHLATKDKADNVAYIARPCQFSGLQDKSKPCDSAYWTGKRFAPEIISAYNDALNEIKARYDIEGFNLIGFSGGGAIAAILAGQRDDVISLRTVAGNLDHVTHSAYHNVSPLQGSLNPPDYAARLRAVPQVHFIGGQDKIVPPVVLQTYLQALGETNCAQHQMIQEAAHEKGWVEKWPELLKVAPGCIGPPREIDPVPLELPEPVYTSPERPEKP